METHKNALEKSYSLVLESYSAIFTGVGKIMLAVLRIMLAKCFALWGWGDFTTGVKIFQPPPASIMLMVFDGFLRT